MKFKLGAWVAATALGFSMGALAWPEANAADHIDAPASSNDAAADITDFYAWRADDKIVAAIGFAGFSIPGSEGTYDDEVLYGIHIDNNGDNEADQTVWARFGQNANGDWGVRFEGIPGGDATVDGAVEETLDAGLNLRAFAGPRDDPFFFDFDGFQATLATGTLSFDSTRDSFRNTNATMVIVELSVDGIAGGSDNIQLWATSARKEGK